MHEGVNRLTCAPCLWVLSVWMVPENHHLASPSNVAPRDARVRRGDQPRALGTSHFPKQHRIINLGCIFAFGPLNLR